MIEVESLSYTYPGTEAPTVKGISFTLGKGEILGFLGPSGSGKSTTQKVLTGILSPFVGDVRVFGQDLRGKGPEYYERIGVGFELPNHFMKLTARENLRFFASFYSKPRDPMELLGMVGLGEHANRRVEHFSKGMKMRLNFARAILHNPSILFLDEPTNGLDPVNARMMKDIVLEQRERGMSVFLTTHNMHDAEELCDQVAFLVDGEIIKLGHPKELRSQDSRRRLIVEYVEDERPCLREFSLDDLVDNQEFLELLRHRKLVSIHSQEPSLEDIFVATTGRGLK